MYAYVGSNPISLIDPSGLTQCDIDFALDFARRHVQDQSLPENPLVMPLEGGVRGRTWHPKDPNNPRAGDFTVGISDQYLGGLVHTQLVDLLEVVIHEGLHIDQPDHLWTLPANDPQRSEYRSRIHDEGLRRTNELREQYRQERLTCGCN